MTILEELYNGNVNPLARFIKDESEYQKLNHQVSEYIDKLMVSLNDEEKQLYEKIADGICGMGYISEKETFIEGFRLGAQMMLEVISYKSENFC